MKITRNIHPYILTALLILTVYNCTPNNQIQQLSTGAITLQLPANTNTTQAYTYQSYNLTIPRRTDRSTQMGYSFAVNEAVTLVSSIMYFDLLVLQTYDASLIINFIYQPRKWSRIGFNYLLSYRSDVYVGVQTYLDAQFTRLERGYRLQSGISISTGQLSIKESDYVVMAFLNGIRYRPQNGTATNAHHLSFAFTEQYLQNSAIVLVFEGCSVGDILSLTFSYVAYAPSSVPFGSYGGTVNQYEFKGRHSRNIQYLFAQYNFISLYGLSGLKTSNRNESGFTLQTQLTQNYSFIYQINDWEMLRALEITYLVMGLMPSALCQKVTECQAAGDTYIYQASCVAGCPITARPMSFIDGAVQCQDCPPNQSYSAKNGSCECNAGYAADGQNNCVAVASSAPTGVTNSKSSSADQLDAQPSLPPLSNCLTLDSVQQSNQNLFVKLKASAVTLADQRSNDKNFIKIVFADSSKAANSYYCNRCRVESEYYECLLLFATGIPQGRLSMRFQCTVESGGVCELVVPYEMGGGSSSNSG